MTIASGRSRLLALLLGSSLLLSASACKSDKKNEGSPTTGATAAATTGRPDPQTLVRNAADTMEQVKSFHWVLEHERGTSPVSLTLGAQRTDLTLTRAEGDVARPDRLRADLDATVSGVKLKAKLVSVGNEAKITNPFIPTSYIPLPAGTKLSDVFDPSAGTTAAIRGLKNPRITGEDTIEGTKTWRVEGDVDATALSALATVAQSGYTPKGTLWIGQSTPYVYRIRLDGPLGAQDNQEVIRRIDLSKFNDNIAITPVP